MLRPFRRFPARGFQHELAELVDQAGIFRHRDEIRRADHAALRMTPAQQRLATADLVVAEIDHRLVVNLEPAPGDGLAQFQLERAPRLGARIHARLEEAIGAAAVALGSVQREVGILQELVEMDAVPRRHRDADAGIGGDQVTGAFEGSPDRAVDRLHQLFGVHGTAHRILDDGEFVPAQPRGDIGLTEAAAQAPGDALQQLVADGMAESVVDALELVDVDIKHGKLPTGLHVLQRPLQLLAEQYAVWQIGERVVMGEMGDLLLGALARGDVLDGGDPAARRQRLVDDLDRAAARGLRDLARCLAKPDIADDGAAERVDVAVEGPGLRTVRDQPLHGAALLRDVGRQAEHLDIGLVAGHNPGRCVVEHEALRDVVHGGAQMTPFLGERTMKPLIAFQEQADR